VLNNIIRDMYCSCGPQKLCVRRPQPL